MNEGDLILGDTPAHHLALQHQVDAEAIALWRRQVKEHCLSSLDLAGVAIDASNLSRAQVYLAAVEVKIFPRSYVPGIVDDPPVNQSTI